jgi:predicted metal-dependent TIM-barrel fold hydrolase
MENDEIHVVPETEESWVVEAGQSGIGSMHETEQSALEEAREMAVAEDAPVVIHGADGQIKDREDPEVLRSEIENEGTE